MTQGNLTSAPVDRDNLESILCLKTTPEQENFVAPNAVSIAQGAFAEGVTMVGLFWNGEAAGFYSMIDPRHTADDPHSFTPDCAYLWRFMIDRRYQGEGVGSRALTLIYDTALAEGFAGLSLTAVPDVPGCPVPFYEKHGFTLTGRMIEDEVELVRRA